MSSADDTRAPFYLHGLTLIPAWITNYIHYKLWGEITYHKKLNMFFSENGHGGSCDASLQDNVMTSQQGLQLLSIQILIGF